MIVDDFTRYTRVLFLKSKDETIYEFVNFSKKQKLRMKGFSIINMSNHGGEFISDLFEMFYEKKKEYHHNFLTPRTPQQNGVEERKRQSF
jgi:hypothetical protein